VAQSFAGDYGSFRIFLKFKDIDLDLTIRA